MFGVVFERSWLRYLLQLVGLRVVKMVLDVVLMEVGDLGSVVCGILKRDERVVGGTWYAVAVEFSSTKMGRQDRTMQRKFAESLREIPRPHVKTK